MVLRRLRSKLLVTGAVLLMVTTAAVFMLSEWERERAEKAAEAVGILPPALGRHVEQLKEALPGPGGESSEGPSSAAELAFFQLAFPDSDIPLSRLEAADAAAKAVRARGLPTGRGRPGTWVTVGPSNALYPFSPFRTNATYVPNEYAARGRTTALAVGPDSLP